MTVFAVTYLALVLLVLTGVAGVLDWLLARLEGDVDPWDECEVER